MATYQKNFSNRQIDQYEEKANDSIIVNTIYGNQKGIGATSRTAAGAYPRGCGVVGSFGDKDYIVNNKAGKSRTSDAGQ